MILPLKYFTRFLDDFVFSLFFAFRRRRSATLIDIERKSFENNSCLFLSFPPIQLPRKLILISTINFLFVNIRKSKIYFRSLSFSRRKLFLCYLCLDILAVLLLLFYFSFESNEIYTTEVIRNNESIRIGSINFVNENAFVFAFSRKSNVFLYSARGRLRCFSINSHVHPSELEKESSHCVRNKVVVETEKSFETKYKHRIAIYVCFAAHVYRVGGSA